MKRIITIASMLALAATAQAQPGTGLKKQIRDSITTATAAKSVTAAILGRKLESLIDTTFKQDSLRLAKSDSGITAGKYLTGTMLETRLATVSTTPDSAVYYIAPFVERAEYTNITGSVTKVGNYWRSTAYNVYSVARANRYLASGKDGYYQIRNFDDSYGGIVFDTTTPTASPSFTIAIVIYNGAVYFGENGAYPSNTSATYAYYRLRRTGSAWYADGSDDEVKWTTVYTYSITYTGGMAPYLLLPNPPPRLARMYEPKLCNTSTKGAILGNSTVASYLGANGVDYYLLNTQETAAGFYVDNHAVPGHTIDQQRAVWQALTTAQKKSYNYVVVEIGLNDLNPAVSIDTTLAKYQQLIDTIYNQKGPYCKILLATMTPCKQRLYDVYGGSGAASWQKWKDINSAIMGTYTTNITKADYRFNQHTLTMENANGNLDTMLEVYGTYDHIHESNAGRNIIAQSYRTALQKLRLLPQSLTIGKPLKARASLDFPNTSAQNSADLTIPLIGAALSDAVKLGVPHSAVASNTSYTAWVSAANTITVRFNNYSSGSVNPSAADFEVSIDK